MDWIKYFTTAAPGPQEVFLKDILSSKGAHAEIRPVAVCLDGAAVIREAGVGVRGKAEPENEAAAGFLTDCQLISGFFRNVSVLTAEARQAGRSLPRRNRWILSEP